MRMFRLSYLLVPLTLAVLLAACGNKGDLIKPTPPADQKPPAAPAQTPTPDPAQH